MASKILASLNRLFKNTFICKRCKQKVRVDPQKILNKTIKCRNCAGKAFRPVSRK